MQIKQSRTVEIKLTSIATNTSLVFSTDEEIDGCYIDSIESFNDGQLITSPDGNPVVNATEGSAIVCVFQVGTKKRIFNYPYQALNTQLNSGIDKEFSGLKINLTKSYILIVNGAGLTLNDSVVFAFKYRKEISPNPPVANTASR